MKLSMLIKLLQYEADNRVNRDDPEVRVMTNDPSIGPHAAVTVVGVQAGFDWDMGRILLTTDPAVVRAKKTATKDDKVNGYVG